MSTHIYVEEIKAAIGAHGAWKMKLKTAITTGKTDLNQRWLGLSEQLRAFR